MGEQTTYTHSFKNDDGTVDIWTYDLSKSPNGPVKVEIEWSDETLEGIWGKKRLIKLSKKKKKKV